MIPIEPNDDLAPAQGMCIHAAICLAGWAVIALIFAVLLYGCEANGGAQASTVDDTAARLNALDAGLEQEVDIRLQAIQKVNEHLALGALVARYNAGLGLGEVYQIGRAIEGSAERHRLDPLLLAAVIVVESHGKARAVSTKGAVGVMQVMPYWLDELGLRGDLFDVETNVNVGAFILADNIRRWGRDEGLRRYLRGNKSGGKRYLSDVKRVMTEMRRDSNA